MFLIKSIFRVVQPLTILVAGFVVRFDLKVLSALNMKNVQFLETSVILLKSIICLNNIMIIFTLPVYNQIYQLLFQNKETS